MVQVLLSILIIFQVKSIFIWQGFGFWILYTLLIPFGKFVFVTQRNCVATAAPLMPQQTSTFESHFFFILTHMQGVAGAYHKLIVYSWVPILQVGGLGKVRVNCFPKAITTWLGWESNRRLPDPESDALTTLPHCPRCQKFGFSCFSIFFFILFSRY